MSNAMLNGLQQATNVAFTENGATARKTTGSEMLDFFSHGGALRENLSRAITLFSRAYAEEPELALKAMFYFRDIRGGQGQRQAFREQLKYLANLNPDVMLKNFKNIPEYGRWDDLYSFMDTKIQGEVLDFMKEQFEKDLDTVRDEGENARISLLGKWLKSENASGLVTKHLGSVTRRHFGLTSRQYRKALSLLRKQINIVERKISSGEWEDIEYKSVPSNAMMKYRKAFSKHDGQRFKQYIEDVKSGKTKINSGVLYPYEIVEKILVSPYGNKSVIDPDVAQAMWEGLPNYVDEDEQENAIAVVDTSGSMTGRPINVAVSLGIYLAERAKGVYSNTFITFSAEPELQKVIGNNITEKVRNLITAKWAMNTNIEKVFNLILNVAINYKINQENMLDRIYIISDMEFDNCTSGQSGWGSTRHSIWNKTLMQEMRQRFMDQGYQIPELVFWNVNARNSQHPMSTDDRGFLNVSGFSPSIFKSLIGYKYVDPIDLMNEVLLSERYEQIRL